MPDTLLDAEMATVNKTKSLPSWSLKTSERSKKKKKTKKKGTNENIFLIQCKGEVLTIKNSQAAES